MSKDTKTTLKAIAVTTCLLVFTVLLVPWVYRFIDWYFPLVLGW